MITILSKLFIKDHMPTDAKRGAYGKLCGLVGIFLNIVLFAIKFFAGIISNSIAIIADAFNNLSDAGSSVVTLVGFKLSEQKPDAKHPYGHGRIEYISGLIVSAVILLMAYEMIKDSIHKIAHPEETSFSILVVLILIISILGKCYMAFYNFQVGKKIDSATLKATGTDSLSDTISTIVVLISAIVGHFTDLHIDGICGVIVGLFILWAGISTAKETVSLLMGEPPEKEYVDNIEAQVLAFDEHIIGVHDLMVHDYGPGRKVISLHAEVPAEGDILEIHDVIDNLEKKLAEDFHCLATIHMDPVITKDPKVDALRSEVTAILAEIDPIISMHDFRIVSGPSHTNLIFDIVLPFRYALPEREVLKLIDKKIMEHYGSQYFAVIQVDHFMA